VGWLLQLLGWLFITCFFFRIDGLWREFLFGRGSTFVVNAECVFGIAVVVVVVV